MAASSAANNDRIPEVVVIGGKMDGKTTLVEALLGFRLHVNEVEMGTRRPLFIHMLKDPTVAEPRCLLKEEDSDKYGSPMAPRDIPNLISKRTKSHILEIQAAVSSKPIVMRAEYAHYSNLTIIVTPGLVLNQFKGSNDLESTRDEILSIVKSIVGEPHRLILFLQQSSVDLCSSIWLDTLKEIYPAFRRTVIVLSMFEKIFEEFEEWQEVNTFFTAERNHGDNIQPFFSAFPDAHGTISNEDFQRQINQLEISVLRDLRQKVNRGFRCLSRYLIESEHQKRKMAFLDNKFMGSPDSELQVKTNVSQLRIPAVLRATSIYNSLHELLDGAADPPPGIWGKTTDEEQKHSSIGSWPGIDMSVELPNSSRKLYGREAFERVLCEFRSAASSMKSPPVSIHQVANIYKGGRTEKAAVLARTAARLCLAPLIDTACDRLAFILRSLIDLAMKCSLNKESQHQNIEDMDDNFGFHAAILCSYYKFVEKLSMECKQRGQQHLDLVTSPCHPIWCEGYSPRNRSPSKEGLDSNQSNSTGNRSPPEKAQDSIDDQKWQQADLAGLGSLTA